MHMFVVGLLAATALASADRIEPSEQAMRVAFALDLADGVRAALAYVAETGGPEALARIHAARTDAFEITSFHKLACRPSTERPGHMCDFAVEVDTAAGPIARTTSGYFRAGPWGLVYQQTTDG
jgi:hypothetical protein